ncbi:hypothetical protein PUNSTDRAFT_136499 [Punctularia strigosozonata HHB-11173 SS5]|uniref:uncharacterized protein n=1 Tax=Punctularia strigosozonata (strain HHB-11173) TaxID=741275 RepID=UPI0004417FB1|nr:uncharacterized protein PUNSTDRAFT_136499 [Punctularia strigosozonata HHB-11173 SS5]EIN06652.1 hypothetical protein PUNSTDRAFT_136499 [Punctularia strigosozonata HHB-11173 SS5]
MPLRPRPVPLEPDSLYVVTQPLLHGAFHWSLLHISSTGQATRHHWARAAFPASALSPSRFPQCAPPRNHHRHHHPSSSSSSHFSAPKSTPTECYSSQTIACPMTATPSTVVLAYFKVRGYAPVPVPVLADICAHAFPRTYGSTEANRAKGLTCRTWVTKVLKGLREAGYLRRDPSGITSLRGPQAGGGGGGGAIEDAELEEEERIEREVTQKSRQCDAEYATAFLWCRGYDTLVTVV